MLYNDISFIEKDIIKVKSVICDTYTRYFIQLNLNGISDINIVVNHYLSLYEYINENNIIPIYEKIFGDINYKNKMVSIRTKIKNTSRNIISPISYVGGYTSLSEDTLISSVLIYGIATKYSNIKIDYIHDSSTGVTGTFLSIKTGMHYYLTGLNAYYNNGISNNVLLDNFFTNLEVFLKKNNLNPQSIIRTWFYLDNIDYSYISFNKARKKFFTNNGINYSSKSKNLPASTCIEGISSSNSLLNCSLIGYTNIDDSYKISRIYNSFQNEPEGSKYLHKPTFSRGMLIESKDYIEVQISGTASINEIGETVYIDDEYGQIKKTILNVKNILDQHNMDFSDFHESTLFFKRREYLSAFKSILGELNIPMFSSTYVVTNVCRNNLLFEIDGIANKSLKQ